MIIIPNLPGIFQNFLFLVRDLFSAVAELWVEIMMPYHLTSHHATHSNLIIFTQLLTAFMAASSTR